METMTTLELIRSAHKTLKYEDDLENLPIILAQLMAATVQLACGNGYSLTQLQDALTEAWRLRDDK
jgi:hypothetical protein